MQPTTSPRTPWPARHPRLVLGTALMIAAGAAIAAAGLSVKADLSHLLPPDARSVRDLEQIKQRAQAFGSLLVGIEADDPAARAAAAASLIGRLRKIDGGLVARVITDDASLRQHVWQHRHLHLPLADLEEADAELRRRLGRLNPLFVDVGADDGADVGGPDRLAALRARLDEAEARAHHPTPLVTRDQRLQMVIVRAPFASSDVSRSRRLYDQVEAALAATRASAPAGVKMGASGDIVTVVLEHEAIVRGMTFASVLTSLLIGLGLLYFFRSPLALAVILGALGVGTVATLAFARLSVGYLNSATAFLISIVIGNGINFPILVVARYLEERRRALPSLEALAAAWEGTKRGTAAAALTAAVAYGSLMITDFRGFRHFGLIGGAGMLLCWLAAYTVTPAALALLGARGHFARPPAEPSVGRWLLAALPRRGPWTVAAVALGSIVALVAGGRYLASDPFEYDLRQVRSSGDRSTHARSWQARLDEGFGRGIVGGFVIALERREDAPAVARQLRALKAPDGQRPLLGRVSSLDDLVPAEQERRLELLAGIRRLIDRNASKFPEAEAALMLRLRPPDDLRPLRDQDVPADLALQFTERDGQRGRLLFANNSAAVDGWDGRQLAALSRSIRSQELPAGTHIAGNAFVFADMVEVIRRDGPRATLVALLGVLLIIGATVGFGRHGLLTAACALVGTAAMLALASLVGLKVNFLDFVALPLTLGIGTDYAANVLSRAREEGPGTARRALRTTGGAVLLCSFTTIVGYGSLFASDNAGIRSFGIAAVLGEIACLGAGLWIAVVLLEALESWRGERAVAGPSQAALAAVRVPPSMEGRP